jgi:hypothetical protein
MSGTLNPILPNDGFRKKRVGTWADLMKLRRLEIT